MNQNKKKNQVTQTPETLSEVHVYDNWTEMTGPFYHVKNADHEVFGPFHSSDLSEFLAHQHLSASTQIKDAKNNLDWSPLYEHPHFQRRKPSLVPDRDHRQIESFLILKDGKPSAPLSAQELDKHIENKQIISTDMVSVDGGHSWIKLYQVPGYDQRSYTASELPQIPDYKNKDVLEKKKDASTSSVLNLAYLESQKIKAEDTQVDGDQTEDHEESSSNSFILISLLILVAITAYMLGGQGFLQKKTTQKKSKITQRGDKKVKQAKRSPAKKVVTREKTQARNSTQRNYREQSARRARNQGLRNRRPKSFTSTPVYKNRKRLKDNALQDDVYDDGVQDIENDPVRKAVSKETLFPEEAELLEPINEDDVYRDEDEYFQEEGEISPAEDIWSTEEPKAKDPFEEDY